MPYKVTQGRCIGPHDVELKGNFWYKESMVITWYGQSCFKVQSGEKTLVFDPFAKTIGLTPPALQADIVLVTHNHPDHANVQAIKGEYFFINGPGEYEVKGVKVLGLDSFHDSEQGAKRGFNTVYRVELEALRLLHLGDLGQPILENGQLEEIDEVDILMVPVGGVFTINAKQAADIIKQIEPKIIIPMHYRLPQLTIQELDGVDKFLEEIGEEGITPQEKLTIKQKELPAEEENTRVVVLKV